jgi:methylmalonyl-CoA/ethylmalonyl-CoA epimerase
LVSGIDHIAIAVNSLSEAIPFYEELLGLELEGIEEVPDQQVRVAFLQVGPTRIELLEPTSDSSPISKFLQKRGPGLHHIAMATDDVSSGLERFKKAGVRLIDEEPKTGAEGKQIAFVHPKATSGVLLELCSEGDPS